MDRLSGHFLKILSFLWYQELWPSFHNIKEYFFCDMLNLKKVLVKFCIILSQRNCIQYWLINCRFFTLLNVYL